MNLFMIFLECDGVGKPVGFCGADPLPRVDLFDKRILAYIAIEHPWHMYM